MKKTIHKTTSKCLALMVLMLVTMLTGAQADTVTTTATFNSSVWGTTYKSFDSSATDSWTNNGVKMAITGDDTYNSSIDNSGIFYVYYPGNLTFTAPTGCTFTGLTITGSGDAVSASTGTMTANATSGGYTWSGSASTLTLSPGTDGRDFYRFESIVVTYEADLNILATTTSDGAEYRFHRYATPFVGVSLNAKTITAGSQEMYLLVGSEDPMIMESPTNGSTYLHMPAGSTMRLQQSENGSNVYITRAAFTCVSGNPDVYADGGEYDSNTGIWTGREEQVDITFNEAADIQLVQVDAAAYAKVSITTYGRGQTAVDGVGIDLENDLNGNPTGTTTVYVAVGGSVALAMTPDDARHELSTASVRESYWDAEDNYHSDETDFLNDAKENGSYTIWNIQHDCDVTIRYSWITHLISYHASGNGTINLVATYLDDDGTSMSYDQAEQMYGGEAARDNTEDRKISIGTGGTVNMVMTADSGYKLSSLLVNDVEMVNSGNLTKDGSVYTYTITPLTAAQTISATFANDTPEAYAALSEDGSGNLVLTFYYDTNKGDDDYVVEPFANYGSRGWDGRSGNITSVVFDDTFANYSPTSTAYWFYGMTSLTDIQGISNLNTASVTSMSYMFYRCSALTSLDLTGFNTAQVTNMSQMFTYCSSLTTIYAGEGWSTAAVQFSANMFTNCTSLVGSKGTTVTNTGADYARIDGGDSAPGYFSDPNAASSFNIKVTVSGNGSVEAGQTTIGSNSEGEVTVDSGASLILAITPDTGYAIGSVMVDTLNVTSEVIADSTGVSYYTLARVYDEHAVTVTFVNNTPEAYAVLSENNTVLTFYYDTNKDVRNGMSVGPFSRSSECGWYSQVTTIQSVVFDDSFVNCRPTSTSYWFAGATTLNSITGLSNLNTSEVTSMSNMFYNCVSLGSLDLSGFNTDNVTDMSAMFAESHIYSLNISSFNTANVTTMRRMFYNTYMTEFDVHHFNTANVTDMNSMFGLCEYITSLDLSSFNTSKVENMGSMFVTCERLSNLDISSFSTENVTDMSDMFYNCKALGTIDLGHFTTGNVTNMSNMFNHCEGLTMLDLSQFNTANVTNMQGMFSYANALTSVNLSSFNTSKVTDMRNMFIGCSALTTLDLGSFNTESVRDMIGTFKGCSSLTTINVSSLWSTTALTSSSFGRSMFSDCTNLVGGAGTTYDAEHTDYTYAHIDEGETNPGYFTDINAATEFDVLVTVVGNGSVSIGSGTISGGTAEHITMPAGGTMTLNITPDTGYAFSSLMLDTLDVTSQVSTSVEGVMTYTLRSIYDAHNITVTFVNNTPEAYAVLSSDGNTVTFYYDSQKASRGGIDINNSEIASDSGSASPYGSAKTAVFDSSFASYRPSSTAYWFTECGRLTSITGMEYLNTANVTDMRYMFYRCLSLTNLDVSNFNTNQVTDMSYMFYRCTLLTSLDVSNFNTNQVTDMSYMFYRCFNLESLDVSKFNTANVTNMRAMFYECYGLTSLDVSNFNTSNVTTMVNMFYVCSGLTSLDVRNFNTANVTDMNHMFNHCSGLTSLDMSNFNTANVTDMSWMFSNCSSLITIYVGNDWSTSALTDGNSMFNGCSSLVGGRGTTYDGDNEDATYARIDMAPNAPGYFTRTAVMGDANDDGFVTIADAVATVTNILGEPAEDYFAQAKADMNNDSTIDIFDVTLIVNAVLAASPAPAYNGGNIAAEDVHMEANANGLTMGISGSEEYTAFQFDVTLPEGTTLEGVRLANKATNHQLAYQKVGDNTYRVVGLSMTNQQLSAANGRLVQLQLSGNADESSVTMSNVLFVGQPATDATAIRNHVADGAADRGAIYDLNGRYVGNDRRQLSKGIYIINHKKVNIK